MSSKNTTDISKNKYHPNSTLLFESRKGNKYLFDPDQKKTILCHPVMYHLIDLSNQGKDLEQWIEDLGENGIDIPQYGNFSKNDVLYYYRKYSLLKENGYFKTSHDGESLVFHMTGEDVKRSLANTPQLTLEITERCGLDCGYCGYGKFYNDYDKRENKDMNFHTAKVLIDYMIKLWNSPLNLSHKKNIYIGFYGGEPLLNFPFIKELVEYLNGLNLQHNRFTYCITANGLLLDKYMDFLVQHQFNTLISLDGSEPNNNYRVYKNGKPAFKDIYKNILDFKSKYPAYFESKVNFNAVLHNLNSVSEIYHFFKDTFNKYPSISPLNNSGIAESQKETFWKTYSNINASLYQSEEFKVIENDMFLRLPKIQELSLFLHKENDFAFDDYNDLIYSKESKSRFPTGTCLPFSKKVFMTVNGKILPCERVGHQHALGTVTLNQGVSIDFEHIARKYSTYFEKLKNQCVKCSGAKRCTQCVLNLETIDHNAVCFGYMSKKELLDETSAYLDQIEKKPGLYEEILKKVVVE